MPIQRIILVRHGEAEHLVTEALTGGWTDTRLTRLGCNQARRAGKALAALLNGADFQFYASDLQRASRTAQIIGQVLNHPPVITASLREINNGAAANRTRAEARTILQPMTQPRMDWQPYPGGETWRQFLARLLPFVENLPETPSTVVLVGHANTSAAVVQWWLGMSDAQIDATHFYISPCSITDLRISQWGMKMVYTVNSTAHLVGLNGAKGSRYA